MTAPIARWEQAATAIFGANLPSPTLHVIYCWQPRGGETPAEGDLRNPLAHRWVALTALVFIKPGRPTQHPVSPLETMSVSPQPASATPNGHPPPFPTMPSPPPNGAVAAQSNAQLAHLLTASYRESDALRKDLAATRKRLDKAERLLASYSAASASGSPPSNNGSATLSIPEAAQRAILECEARADRAEHARDEADARRRVLSDAWEELNRYLHVVELRAADARAGFARLVAEGGGQLVLAPVPLPGYLAQPPIPPSPAIMLAPQRSHRHSSSLQSSHGIPPLPPPPHPTARVRPRSGSFDESSYPAGQPPAKRSRSERDYDRVYAAPTSVSGLTPPVPSAWPPRRRCPQPLPSPIASSHASAHPRAPTALACVPTLVILVPLIPALPLHR